MPSADYALFVIKEKTIRYSFRRLYSLFL